MRARFQRPVEPGSCLTGVVVLAGDVQMQRVKMNAKHEYEFIGNFKILQNIFRAKKIDKARRARPFEYAQH